MDLRSLLIVWLPLFLLLIFLILIVAMFVSLARQGDERRRMIVQTASANTFAVTVLYLLGAGALTSFPSKASEFAQSRRGEPIEKMNPHRHTLTVIVDLPSTASSFVLLQTEVR